MTRFQQNISQEESNQSPVSIYGRFCQQRLKVPSTIQMGSIRFDHVCISLRGVIGAVSRTTTAILFLLQCRRRGNSILLRHSHIHLLSQSQHDGGITHRISVRQNTMLFQTIVFHLSSRNTIFIYVDTLFNIPFHYFSPWIFFSLSIICFT
jgi:hypothetical protein